MLKTADCKDTWVASALWGRVGSAILVMLSVVLGGYGLEFSEVEQAATFESISAILASLGAILAIISKVREGRSKDSECLSDGPQIGRK